jgi:hypothetical protein
MAGALETLTSPAWPKDLAIGKHLSPGNAQGIRFITPGLLARPFARTRDPTPHFFSFPMSMPVR